MPRPQLSYADFVLDLDKFEGKTDGEILAYLKYLATNATEGQLMTACDLSPSVDINYTRLDLMNLYIRKTIETIQRLRH
jgi:hypothetical protein